MDEPFDEQLSEALKEKSDEWLHEAAMKCVNEPGEDWVFFGLVAVRTDDMVAACVREMRRRKKSG